MKTTQRKFVVEYKSSRRQSKASSTSIWGDANLKELLEQAEAEIPGVPFVTAVSVARAEIAASLEGEGTAEQPWAGHLELDNVAPAVPVDPVSHQIASEQAKEVLPIDTNSATTDLRQERKQAAEPKRVRANESSSALTGVSFFPSVASSGSVVIDDGEIGVLEAENRRLKKLLVGYLRKENEALRIMLAC